MGVPSGWSSLFRGMVSSGKDPPELQTSKHPKAMKIGEIFEPKITEKIEPVIKVGEVADDTKVAQEIGSFVVTPILERYIDDFLEHYTDTIRQRTSEIGVWISGYFGSGKSHLAKMLAQVTANRNLNGMSAAERFNARIPVSADRKKSIERALGQLKNCSTRVLAFNLNTLTDSRNAELSRLLLSQFYQSKGYSSNFIFAKVIEAELDKLGKLQEFHALVETKSRTPWEQIQGNPNFYRQHLYSAVCVVAPELFVTPEEVGDALRNAQSGELYNIEFLVKTILDDLRQQEKETGPARVFFVLDESGQWIEDNLGRLAQLQALVEEAAKQGQGKIWILVTTHEDMAAVYKNAHALAGDFKKIEGRFRFKFGLTTENIELVLEDRIFKKKLAGKNEVEQVYRQNAGVIRGVGELANVTQKLPECTNENFCKFYPFFPYQIHLIPEVVKSLRSRGGRAESLSGSTRTLLAITQDVIRAGRRNYLNAPVGDMVSFDEIYHNLRQEGEINPDIRREIGQIADIVPDATPLTGKVVEVLYLIHDFQYIPRTIDNLTRLLIDQTSQDVASFLPTIAAELDKLRKAKLVARIGDEWEFLTGERRDFEDEVSKIATELRYQDREGGLYKMVNPHVLGCETVPFHGYDFQICLYVDQKALTKHGDIEIRIISPFGLLTGKSISEFENESLKETGKQTIYVVSGRVPQFSEYLDRYIAMNEVLETWRKKPQLAANARELVDNKTVNELPKLKKSVEDALREGLKHAHVIFRGSSRPLNPRQGQTAGDALRLELSHYFGNLYPKYEKLPVRITQDQRDVAEVLTGSQHPSNDVKALKLYDKTGHLDPHTPLIDEIRLYLMNRQNRNQRTLGQELLEYFEKPPYGWDPNAVRVGIAAMVREGQVRIALGKKVFTNLADNDLVTTMRNSRQFKKAEVILEETDIDPDVLMEVRKMLINLTGSRKIDETPSDIAAASTRYVRDIRNKANDVQIWANAAGFPIPVLFQEGVETITSLLNLTNPVHHVNELRAKSQEMEAEMDAITRVHRFYEKWGQTFVEMKDLIGQLHSIEPRLSGEPDLKSFLENFNTARQEATIHEKAVWRTLQDNKANALTAIESLKRSWQQQAQEVLRILTARLDAERSAGVLTEEDMALVVSAHQQLSARIDSETGLVQTANLPEAIEREVTLQLQMLQSLRQAKNLGKPRNVRKIKVLSGPRTITSQAEWDRFRDDLDQKVRTILNQGDDIELN